MWDDLGHAKEIHEKCYKLYGEPLYADLKNRMFERFEIRRQQWEQRCAQNTGPAMGIDPATGLTYTSDGFLGFAAEFVQELAVCEARIHTYPSFLILQDTSCWSFRYLQ